MRALLLSAAAALAPVMAGPVQAHAIESSLERLADARGTLELQSRFSSGVPAADALVTLVSPDGVSRTIGHTNAQGQLRFAVPRAADANWELRVDLGPGHRDYLELPSAERAAAGHPHPPMARLFGLQGALAWAGGMSLLLVGGLAVWRRPGL